MYQDHFGLHADPFALSPNLKFLYRSQAHAETMAHLGYGLEQGEDIIMISGAIGTGKTLALQNLLAKVSRLFEQVLVNVTAVSYVEFLKLVLDEMGQTWSDHADVADLLVLMKRQARAVNQEGRKILLVVDEAQNLDPETLEGVRLLTNMGQPDKQFFQIVLAGQPGLEQLVEHPDLAQLRQRIRVHYRLEPLSLRETEQYLQHRTSVAGALRPLFTVAAAKRIHELSGGIPRLVNHLAGHAMLAAFVDKDRQVDVRHVAAEGLPAAPTPPVDIRPAPAAEPPRESVDRSEPATSRPRTTRSAEAGRGGRRAAVVWLWITLAAILLVGGWWLTGRDGDLLAWTRPTTPDLPTQSYRQEPRPAAPSEADQLADAVDLEAEPEPAPVTPITEVARPAVTPATQHWVHVASYQDRRYAERFGQRLGQAGIEAVIQPATLAEGQVWQRVVVGPYRDAAAADAAARDLQQRGFITFHRLIEE